MTDRAPDSQWPTKDEARQMGTDAARMTAPDIVTEARQLLDAATPGPWYCFTDDSAGKDHLELWCDYDDGSWQGGLQPPFHLDPFCYDPTPLERATAHFIAAAPRLVTELVAEVERLRHELDAAQLRSIEARNPGIDMDEVRRVRGGDQ